MVILAWSLATKLMLDLQETGRVVKHIEDWDVEPGKVIRSLLKPSARVPQSQVGGRCGVWGA